MPRIDQGKLVPLQVIGAEQHHEARALLEDRGLLVKAENPGGAIGPLGLAYGFTNIHGALWVRQSDAEQAQQLIENAGLFVTGALRPIVDRSEPHCPQCGGDLDTHDADEDGMCATCGFEFTWVNIDEPEVDPDGMLCDQCHYDLTGNTERRCPECGAPIYLDTAVIVNQAVRDAGWQEVLRETRRPLSTESIVRSGVIIASLILGLFLGGVAVLSDQFSIYYLVASGVIFAILCTIVLLGDRSQASEVGDDDS